MARSCIVMKFGGTSVGDAKAILRVCEIARGRLPLHPVVVVSAMARVTDQLLQMARAAGSGCVVAVISRQRNCGSPR